PRVLEGHTDSVNAVALSTDGKRAISGCLDNTVRVWDLESSAPPHILEGHALPVHAVALSTDGKRAISGSDDNTLLVWDLKESCVLAAFACDAPPLALLQQKERILAFDRLARLHVLALEE